MECINGWLKVMAKYYNDDIDDELQKSKDLGIELSEDRLFKYGHIFIDISKIESFGKSPYSDEICVTTSVGTYICKGDIVELGKLVTKNNHGRI